MGSSGWVRAVGFVVGSLWLFASPLTAAPQLELVSRSVPELRSDTAVGYSTTSNSVDSSRFTYAHPPRVSADGRWIVFTSDAPNLVTGQIDQNGQVDVFLHDRQTGTTILVSRAAGATTTTANHGSFRPSLSADGRYVAFLSWATNLVPGQVDELPFSWSDEQDVFLFDRVTGTMVLVSRKDGTAATAATGDGWDPFVSADGRFVAFLSDASDLIAGQIPFGMSLFLFDREAGTTKLVSHRNGSEQEAAGAAAFAFSANGGWLVFLSSGEDLVPGQSDANNWTGAFDFFLYEVSTGAITLVTHASGSPTTTGNTGHADTNVPSISADGSRIAFASEATDLVNGFTYTTFAPNIFLYDRVAGTTTLVSSEDPGVAAGGVTPAISSNGTRIVFGRSDIFSYEVASGATTLISHSSSSTTQGGNSYSQNPALTENGSKVLFESAATDLVSGQTDTEWTIDLFLFEQSSGTISLVNHESGSAVTPTPAQGSDFGRADAPFLADDGHVVFSSESEDLVSGLRDGNGKSDVFLYDPSTGGNQAISVHAPSLPSVTGNGVSNLTSMSADGRFVVFGSTATDLVPGQDDRNWSGNSGNDVFLHDRLAGETFLVSHAAGSPAVTGNNISREGVISRDGRFVVFSSHSTDLITGQTDTNEHLDVFLYERASGQVTLLSHVAGSANVTGDSASRGGLISADGRFIAFSSSAKDLVSGVSDVNTGQDVFLHDRLAGTTTLISHTAGAPASAANGTSAAGSLSADGRLLAFTSKATNLVSGLTDENSGDDVFLYDRVSGTMALASRSSGLPATTADAASISPELSGDGRFVVFYSAAANLVPGQTGGGVAGGLFLYDRSGGTMALVSHASDSSVTPAGYGAHWYSIDDHGDFIAFVSSSTNLVVGQIDTPPLTFQPEWDVFLYDRRTATNILVSHTADSAVTAANQDSNLSRISGDGTQIAFLSGASDLVAGQPLSGFDAYLYHRLKGTTTLLSPASFPSIPPFPGPPDQFPASPLISQDGHFVAFSSRASSLVAQDFNGALDVFLSSDPVPPADFFTVAPCRLLDTRQAGQGPALTSGAPRTVLVHGFCSIPETARAIAVNITVTGSSGNGNLTAFPGDFLIPPLASTVNFQTLQTRANNAIVSLAPNGTLALQAFVAAGGTAHVIVDVSGYFVE